MSMEGSTQVYIDPNACVNDELGITLYESKFSFHALHHPDCCSLFIRYFPLVE